MKSGGREAGRARRQEKQYVFQREQEDGKENGKTQTVVGEDGVAKTKTVETITHQTVAKRKRSLQLVLRQASMNRPLKSPSFLTSPNRGSLVDSRQSTGTDDGDKNRRKKSTN